MLEQAGGVPRLQVLGQDQPPHIGVGAADLLRRDQALVGVGGRHLDVDDRHVGMLVGHDLKQLAGVAGLAGDLHPSLLKKAGGSLPDQHGVVGDHDAHGISARMVVVPPAASSARSVPLSAPTRSATSQSPASSSCRGEPCPVMLTRSRPPTYSVSTITSFASAWAARRLASAMRKYPAASTGGGSRCWVRWPIVTGMGLVSESASTAAASPSP